jgi:hypothetical protein
VDGPDTANASDTVTSATPEPWNAAMCGWTQARVERGALPRPAASARRSGRCCQACSAFLQMSGHPPAAWSAPGGTGDQAHHDAAAVKLLTWKFSFTPPVLDISNP